MPESRVRRRRSPAPSSQLLLEIVAQKGSVLAHVVAVSFSERVTAGLRSIQGGLSKEPAERGAKKETERPRLKRGPLGHWNG
jgi:hypothetical protein